MPSYRETPEMAQQLAALIPIYGGKTKVFAAALEQLHRVHFPSQHPVILGYDGFITAVELTCSETGRTIPAGAKAWREYWSDDRQGAVVSHAYLIASDLLEEDGA